MAYSFTKRLQFASLSFSLARPCLENSKKKGRETSNYLSKLFSRYNLTDSAYKYQDIYITIQDSLFNSDKIRSLQIATIQENIKQEKIREKIIKKNTYHQNLM